MATSSAKTNAGTWGRRGGRLPPARPSACAAGSVSPGRQGRPGVSAGARGHTGLAALTPGAGAAGAEHAGSGAAGPTAPGAFPRARGLAPPELSRHGQHVVPVGLLAVAAPPAPDGRSLRSGPAGGSSSGNKLSKAKPCPRARPDCDGGVVRVGRSPQAGRTRGSHRDEGATALVGPGVAASGAVGDAERPGPACAEGGERRHGRANGDPRRGDAERTESPNRAPGGRAPQRGE
jgi:hypothetical protein